MRSKYHIDLFYVIMAVGISLRVLLMCLYGLDWDSFTIITLCIFLMVAKSKNNKYG